jgi:DNA ligase 1
MHHRGAMRRFAALFDALDASTATGDKVAAMVRYFADAPPADAAWAAYCLAGGRQRQVVPTALLRATAERLAGIDSWLFEECYQAVGDLAETIAHVVPAGHAPGADIGLAAWMEERLLPLAGLSPAEQQARLERYFAELDAGGRFLLVKLVGGGFRVGVSKLLVQRALAQHAGLDAKRVAERMMGYTDARQAPSAARYLSLVAPDDVQASADSGQPYPFFLAHALEGEPAALGPIEHWQLEWKYDGIRAQIVRRAGRVWIWSRGEELITERFPEIVAAAQALPEGTVLDGEVLVWRDDAPAPEPFQRLQQRINRKAVSKKLLAEAPVVFCAYDLLQTHGRDLRALPQAERRSALESVVVGTPLRLAPRVSAASWTDAATARARARERGVEGLMLKERSARYGSGRTKTEGLWLKWKVDPLAVDAVLVYAQAGHGRRASLYTDYTFAVWSRAPRDAAEAQAVVEAIARREPPPPADSEGLRLLPFAKAYSGLSDAEIAAVDREIRSHTIDKFGPVRSVRPTLVFEIGFEGIGASPRHKSGIAVRFPRILRKRDDKPLHEADTLATLQALLQSSAATGAMRGPPARAAVPDEPGSP